MFRLKTRSCNFTLNSLHPQLPNKDLFLIYYEFRDYFLLYAQNC